MHMGQMAAGQTTARRANTSRYAILGVLSRRAMSGYDVKKLIERSIAHFWSESYGQIYPSLNRLADEGLAERRRERQRGKPDRHVYSLTSKGRAELLRWLALPARLSPQTSLESLRQIVPYKNEKDLERFLGAMRKAGLK